MNPGDTVGWSGTTGDTLIGVLVGWTPAGKPRVRRWVQSSKKLGSIQTVDKVWPTRTEIFVDSVRN